MTDNHLFVPEPEAGAIAEYVAGAMLPSTSLSDAGQSPVDCAVDPKTGALAVANSGSSSNPPSVAIYRRIKRHWSSTPSQVSSDNTMLRFDYCAFDNEGNLYLTGTDTSNATAERTFQPGSTTFGDLSLNQTLNAPGGIFWDGTHVAIADNGVSPNVVYQFQITGTNGVETGSTTLYGSQSVQQYWIYDGVLVGPDPAAFGGSITIWSYPAGGSPIYGASPVTATGAAVVITK